MNQNIRNLIFSILLISIPASTCAYQRLANSDKQGLNLYSIERILQLEDDQIDLGTAALLLSRQWGTRKNLYTWRSKLDEMAEEILERLEEKHLPPDHRAIKIINDYLFEELKFTPVETADDPEDLFLHTVIEKKRGYCLSLSVLYLSIGERIGMPLYGVVVPGHFFVRYDDGATKLNIETTSKGNIAPDKHYIEKFNPPNSSSIYMKNLTNAQTLGCFFNNLGNSYSDINDMDSALIELERSVKINPSLAEARTNLGNIYLKKDRIADAINQYQVALGIIPDDPKTHNNLANALSQADFLDRAVTEYTVSLKLDPEFHDARKNLANTYRKQKNFKQAIAELRLVTNNLPDDAQAYSQLGDVYSDMKEYQTAIKYYQISLNLNPNSANTATGLAYAYMGDDQLPRAADQFVKAIDLDQNNTSAYFGLALACNKLDWTDEEIDIYTQLLAIDPDMVPALQNLGNAYIKVNMFDQAIQKYVRAINLEPNNYQLRFNLAVAYTNLELYNDSIQQLKTVIQYEPQNAAAHSAIAINYFNIHDLDKARKHTEIAKQLGYDVPEELLNALKNNK